METRERTKRAPVVIESGDSLPVPASETATALGRMELHDLRAVRKEMGKLYREMRRGALSTAEGCRLVFVLSSIGRLIEAGELEQRLRTLEEQTK